MSINYNVNTYILLPFIRWKQIIIIRRVPTHKKAHEVTLIQLDIYGLNKVSILKKKLVNSNHGKASKPILTGFGI